MTERNSTDSRWHVEEFSDVLTQRLKYALLSLMLLAQSVYVQGNSEATLTAPKAVSVPGGYVVPVHDDIVFRCHLPSFRNDSVLLWNIDLGPLTLLRIQTLKLEMNSNQKLTVNENYENNPAEVHIHNLQLNESGSKIQCLGVGMQEVISSVVCIFVEDSPKCPGNLTITETPLGFNLTWSGHSGLLPVTHNISVVSHCSEVVVSTSNSHYKTLDLEESGYNWQSNTTYFVSVTACTSAGCSRDCCNISMHTGDLENMNDGDCAPTRVDNTSTSLSDVIIPIVVVPAVVAFFIITLIVVVLSSWCIICCRMSKTIRDIGQKSAAQQNDHEHISGRELKETKGVSDTSIDVTGVVMEENPAYGTVPIRMGETDIAELPPPLPLRPQDTVNIDMQENPSYSPLQTVQ